MSDTGDQVAVAWVQSARWSASFGQSLLQLALSDGGKRIKDRWGIVRYSTGGIVEARNDTVRWFFELVDEPDWLLLLDTDIAFPPGLIVDQLDAANNIPQVLGALCFVEQEMYPDGMGGFNGLLCPTIYDLEESGLYRPRWDYEQDTIIECDATGTGCLFIHREVLEAVGTFPFNPMPEVSEDVAFCRRVKERRFPIRVNTSMKCTHHKDIWFGEQHYLPMRESLRGVIDR